jgi:TPP-dependent pyruvate/acetoin dehydrogenase alpha subunit
MLSAVVSEPHSADQLRWMLRTMLEIRHFDARCLELYREGLIRGSMHIADLDRGILGANGIVGGGMGLATGATLSTQLRRSGQVAVCFFGDGALNQGVLHEVSNLAAMWKLPVVYVCENNQYAMSARADVLAAGAWVRPHHWRFRVSCL